MRRSGGSAAPGGCRPRLARWPALRWAAVRPAAHSKLTARDLGGDLGDLVAVTAQDDLDFRSPAGKLLGHRPDLAKALLASEIAAVEHLDRRMGDRLHRLGFVRGPPQRHPPRGGRNTKSAAM